MGRDWQRYSGKSGVFISVDSCGLRLAAIKCCIPFLPMPRHHEGGDCW